MKIVSSHGLMIFDEMEGSLESLPKTTRPVQIDDINNPTQELAKKSQSYKKKDDDDGDNRGVTSQTDVKADCWTSMCYFVKNETKFMRELCRVLTEICRLLGHFCSESLFFTVLSQSTAQLSAGLG